MNIIETMTKTDIENGMIVEFRNGNKGMILGNKIFCSSDIINLITCSFSLCDFNNDLTHNLEKDLDIVKVYMIRDTDKISLTDVIRGVTESELVWDRHGRYKGDEKIIELMKTLSRDELQNVYQSDGIYKIGDIPEYALKSIARIIMRDCPEIYNINEPDTPNGECLGTCTECWYRSLNDINNK